MICPTCSQINLQNAKFCFQCGKPLPILTSATTATKPAHPQTQKIEPRRWTTMRLMGLVIGLILGAVSNSTIGAMTGAAIGFFAAVFLESQISAGHKELEERIAKQEGLTEALFRRLNILEGNLPNQAPVTAPDVVESSMTPVVLTTTMPAGVHPVEEAIHGSWHNISEQAASTEQMFAPVHLAESVSEKTLGIVDVPPPHKREAPPWQRIEQMFIENWTGILGAVVVVAGMTFLGIYTALQLAPFYRFLMTIAVAGALVGASEFLRRRESWQALAQWVRSAGAAIFLFACAASGGLPGLGLQWIEAPTPALALLLLGLAVNLYLAWTAVTQRFASLHIILGLLPLTIVPQSAMTLGIASAVALFGVMLSFRARWDQHLLSVIVAYLLHHVAWYLRMEEVLRSQGLRLVGVLCAIAVFLTAALVHYRKDYASQKLEPWPLLVHISNWALLALALLVYPSEAAMRGLALALAGMSAYLLARRARPLGIRWLYLSDTLIGQILFVAAIVSLYPFIANIQIVLLVLLLETLLFLRLVVTEDEEFLGRIGWYAVILAGLIFAIGGIHALDAEVAVRNQTALIMLLGAAAATVAYLYLTRKYMPRLLVVVGYGVEPAAQAQAVGVMGWLVGMVVIVGLLNLIDGAWMEITALLAAGGLLLVSRAMSPPGLMTGTGGVVVAAHLMSWRTLLLHMPWEAASLAQHVGPLIMLATLTTWIADSGVLRQVAIYLLGLNAALAAYLFFDPVSPLIPGVAWLLLSLLALELANRLERPSAIPTLMVGYLYLAAFIGAYALVIIQTQTYLGPVPARLLIELFGLSVILYWWFLHPRQALEDHPAWLRVHPFFLELGLIALAATNIVEVPDQWRPLTWSLLPLTLLAQPIIRHFDKRLQMYSLIFYWVSVADVAIIMSAFESPSPHWYDRPDVMSAIAIALQILYIIMSHKRLALAGLRYPDGLAVLGTLGQRITARRNLWVYYPFFAGVALFLFWRFDRSVLTLLWAAEAFAVFVLSAVLRENQFRHAALAGLGACLFRLVLIDMAEANLGMRGLVFMGVGLLMLGMNAIYNRYRARFQ